jgi:Uma2 family endonuclease
MLKMAPESEAQDPRAQWALLQDFLSFDSPKGYRVELIDGEIVVTPPPDGDHARTIWRITVQVSRNSAVEMEHSAQTGLIVPSRGNVYGARVIPDGIFAPAELDVLHKALSWMPPAGIALVLEVTSSRPELDRVVKRQAYATAGIPLYLLVDRDLGRVTLFSDPTEDDYKLANSVRLGGKLDLPKPFDFTLDTAPFAD